MDAQFAVLNQIIAQNKASSKEMKAATSGQAQIDTYETQMINARNKVNQSPGELKAAQKAYYIAVGGLSKYQDFKESQAKKDITPIIASYENNFESELKELQGYVNVLISQTLYTGRMDDIRNNYVTKQKELENKVLSTRSKKNVDDRLANFYTKQTEFNNEFVWGLNKLYWGLIIALLAAIIYNGQYKNKITVGIFFSLILIVYVGKTLREWIKIDVIFKSILTYLSQVLMYITFSVRILLDKLF